MEFAAEGFIDLSAWRGGRENPRFAILVKAIRAVMDGRPAPVGVGNRKRSTRAVRLAKLSVTGASLGLGLLGLVANIGGTRDFICSFSALGPSCIALGIKSQADADAETKAALREKIKGDWGKPGCRRIGHFSFDGEVLVQKWPQVDGYPKFESRSSIDGYGNGLLFVRDKNAVPWTLTVTGRHMSLKPEGGPAETPLFKCG